MACCRFCNREFKSSQSVIAHLKFCPSYKQERKTQPSPAQNSDQLAMTTERRAWFTLWKERAVNALPSTAPVKLKVAVRQAVETALAAYGPEDTVSEIRDLVTVIASEMTDELIAETRTKERDARKQTLLLSVEMWIDDVMLAHLPPELVGAPRSSKRRQVVATLRTQIRESLSTELTGDEPLESVIRRMQEAVAIWAIGQNPLVDRRTLLLRLAPWAVAALAGGVAAASWSPELKTVMRKGAQKLTAALASYKPAATRVFKYGLAQAEQWAKTHYPQEPPKEPPT